MEVYKMAPSSWVSMADFYIENEKCDYFIEGNNEKTKA